MVIFSLLEKNPFVSNFENCLKSNLKDNLKIDYIDVKIIDYELSNTNRSPPLDLTPTQHQELEET